MSSRPPTSPARLRSVGSSRALVFLFERWRVLSNDERQDLAARVTERDAPTVAWLLGWRGDFGWFASRANAAPLAPNALVLHAGDARRGWEESQELVGRIAALVRGIEPPGAEAIATLKDNPIAQLRLWLAALRRWRIDDESRPFTPEQITGLQRTWRVVVDESDGGLRGLGLGEAEEAVAELLNQLACLGRGRARPSPLRPERPEWVY